MKHDYTNDVELTSLLIRIKNTRKFDGTVKTSKTLVKNDPKTVSQNTKINRYVKLYTKLNALDTKNLEKDYKSKLKNVQKHVKANIIKLSEASMIDGYSYEKFGEIIMLMINKIMTKTQFRGYSYQDDFVSDSVYKILKYLDNFDHKMISKITGQPVSAFSYLTQIIHMAILFVINKKKKEQNFIFEQIRQQRMELGLPVQESFIRDEYNDKQDSLSECVELSDVTDLSAECLSIIETYKDQLKNKKFKLTIKYNNYKPEIDDLSFLYNIKKTYKNVEIKGN